MARLVLKRANGAATDHQQPFVHPNVTGDTNVNANSNANVNTSLERVHILGGEFGALANQSTFPEGAPSSVVISPTHPSRNSPLCGCELVTS